jgi:hypothetical protein
MTVARCHESGLKKIELGAPVPRFSISGRSGDRGGSNKHGERFVDRPFDERQRSASSSLRIWSLPARSRCSNGPSLDKTGRANREICPVYRSPRSSNSSPMSSDGWPLPPVQARPKEKAPDTKSPIYAGALDGEAMCRGGCWGTSPSTKSTSKTVRGSGARNVSAAARLRASHRDPQAGSAPVAPLGQFAGRGRTLACLSFFAGETAKPHSRTALWIV